MGLSEPRRKLKMSHDPNNTTWGNDTSKLGYQLLNKMGWQDGQGLGRNKDGNTDHIKVRVKNNALGVGAKKGNDDNWLELQASFNNLLENLTQSHTQGVDNSAVTVSALEEKTSSSRRIFYSRFVKSKDVSKYSETDMASIFGERSKPATPEPTKDSKDSCTYTGVTTTTNSLSINDYFAARLAERKSGIRPADSAVQSETPTPSTTTESEGDADSVASASGKEEKSTKKRKRDLNADDAEDKRTKKKQKKDKKGKSKKSTSEKTEKSTSEKSKKKKKDDKADDVVKGKKSSKKSKSEKTDDQATSSELKKSKKSKKSADSVPDVDKKKTKKSSKKDKSSKKLDS